MFLTYYVHLVGIKISDSVITIQTKKRTQFYYNHNILTTQQLLHVLGLIGPSTGSTHL